MSDENKSKNTLSMQLVPFLVVLLIIVSFFAGGLWTKLKSDDSKKTDQAQTQTQDQNTAQDQTQDQTQAPSDLTPDGVEGTFSYQDDLEVCKEDGKPVVYLFSTTWCPHCIWIKDTFDKVAKEYVDKGEIAAYHWELDTNDNTLTSEEETQVPTEANSVYQKFNPRGSIPTFVFGCKYWRVGNGYEAQEDLAAEEQEFRSLIDELVAES